MKRAATAATEMATTPPALIEAALASELDLYVRQAGWRWDAAYLDDDVSTFIWADDPILGLSEPPQLRPGPVSLLPEHLDQLRNGKVFVREIVDLDTGLRVRLVEPIWITWDSLLVDANEWAGHTARTTSAQLPQTSTTSTTEGTIPSTTADYTDIVSENQAVERLRGLSKAAARRWLRREGLSREVAPAGDEGGRKRPARLVFWPDVVACLRQPRPTPETRVRAKRQRQPTTAFGVKPGRLDNASVDGKTE